MALAIGAATAACASPGVVPLAASELGLATTEVEFLGVKAVKVVKSGTGNTLVALPTPPFRDGAIELKVAGAPVAGANPAVRGFFGLAFGVAGPERYECFYLRATNGRSDDPVRRGHAVQYVSSPDYGWPRLREEHPGRYETAADIGPNEWVRLRIELRDGKALIYVNGAQTPTLEVERLAADPNAGGLALWVGPGSEAYFADLTVTPAR